MERVTDLQLVAETLREHSEWAEISVDEVNRILTLKTGEYELRFRFWDDGEAGDYIGAGELDTERDEFDSVGDVILTAAQYEQAV